MTDRCELHYYPGRSIKGNRAKKSLKSNQKAHFNEFLERFHMQDCKPASIPMETGVKYERLKDYEEPANVKEYYFFLNF